MLAVEAWWPGCRFPRTHVKPGTVVGVYNASVPMVWWGWIDFLESHGPTTSNKTHLLDAEDQHPRLSSDLNTHFYVVRIEPGPLHIWVKHSSSLVHDRELCVLHLASWGTKLSLKFWKQKVLLNQVCYFMLPPFYLICQN